MGRTAKLTRLHSHAKAKRHQQGKLWKQSVTVKVRQADKKARRKVKKLKGDVVRSTEAYSRDCGFKGTFMGSLVKKIGDTWRVQWQDGTVQDGMQEAWFERVVKDGLGGWVATSATGSIKSGAAGAANTTATVKSGPSHIIGEQAKTYG